VFLCQDVFPEVTRLLDGFQNRRVEAMLTRIAKYTVRQADRIIVLGDTMKRRLIETKDADPAKIRVIHNWADTQAVQPGPKDNPYSREHGLVDKFVVMHSGNVGMSQDVDGLLDVAERLRNLPDVVVAIVGDGSRKPFLQEEAARRALTNVRFFPYTPKARLAESFAAADVFIVSLKRGLAGYIVPSKLCGILAAGRPFIAAVEGDCEAAGLPVNMTADGGRTRRSESDGGCDHALVSRRRGSRTPGHAMRERQDWYTTAHGPSSAIASCSRKR
jgi:glycosyltransferase involved in cell wall biosynthesis